MVDSLSNCLIGEPKWKFGSYGIGDSDEVSIADGKFGTLKTGGRVDKRLGDYRRERMPAIYDTTSEIPFDGNPRKYLIDFCLAKRDLKLRQANHTKEDCRDA